MFEIENVEEFLSLKQAACVEYLKFDELDFTKLEKSEESSLSTDNLTIRLDIHVLLRSCENANKNIYKDLNLEDIREAVKLDFFSFLMSRSMTICKFLFLTTIIS